MRRRDPRSTRARSTSLRRIQGSSRSAPATVMPLTGNNWTVRVRSRRSARAGRTAPARRRLAGGNRRIFHDAADPAARGTAVRADRSSRAGRRSSSSARRSGDRFFPGESPVGRRIRGGDGGAEIVGVVGNIRRASLTDSPRADMYFPGEQASAERDDAVHPHGGRSARRGGGRALDAALDRAAASCCARIQTMDEVARESVQITRLALWLLGAVRGDRAGAGRRSASTA